MIYRAVLLVLLAACLVVQEFLPEIEVGGVRATLLLLPTVFLCSVATLEYASMIGFAAVGGLLWDLRYAPAGISARAAEEARELAGEVAGAAGAGFGGDLFFGSTIVFYALAGTVMFGVTPRAREGRVVLPALMVGVSLFLLQTGQFLALNLFRGGFDLPWDLLRRMIYCAAAGTLAAAPLIVGLRLAERFLKGPGDLPALEFQR
ncbi:MAG TPA: hypothetical protein VMN36_05200 [Verrucomicrobiales bacterium]|nr:hypothetical protein [Verrucomicrobiales bacterium]